MPFVKRNPVKRGLKFVFNHKALHLMKYGDLYSRLNSAFLRVDVASTGYLTTEEIKTTCTREGMEAYADVVSDCVTDGDVVSYVDFCNALKQVRAC